MIPFLDVLLLVAGGITFSLITLAITSHRKDQR